MQHQQFYGYVYITTNTLNNKRYIGQKTSSVFLGERYLGSGTLLKRSVKKYGRKHFRVDLICWAHDDSQLNHFEKYFIEKFDCVSSDDFYNMIPGGSPSRESIRYFKEGARNPMYGKTHTQEARDKISAAHKGKHLTKDHRNNISAAQKGKTLTSEHKQKIGQAHKGKQWSEESKQKFRRPKSEEHKQAMRKPKTLTKSTCIYCGHTDITRIITRYHNSNCLEGPTPKSNHNTRKGYKCSAATVQKMQKPKSEEHKQSLRKPKKKTTCPHCNKTGGGGNMLRYHFDNCKHKNS